MSLQTILFQLAVDTKVPVNGGVSSSVQNVPTIGADKVFEGILNGVYYMIGIAAVIALIVGGIMYATSSGDANGISKAKNIIIYAVVGIIVTLMAFTITGFVINRVG